MVTIGQNIFRLQADLHRDVCLVAVSKTKPNSFIEQAYEAGQRHFGENKAQELAEKAASLPSDIHWHFIGHLQRNKVKYIIPYVHLIHSIDSLRLLEEVSKQALKHGRVVGVLLQLKIAQEDEKTGLKREEALAILEQHANQPFPGIQICGVMGMATQTEDKNQILHEFKQLKAFFNEIENHPNWCPDHWKTCSMGMSGDFEIAIEAGGNMVRVGSRIFGIR